MSLDISKIIMTRHATDRALDMSVTGDEIKQCLLHPEVVSKSRKYDNTKNYQAGRIVLAVRNEYIVTVGWATPELWREDLSIGEYSGRTIKASGYRVR